LWTLGKTLWEKQREEKLRIPKAEVLKRTRAVDLRRTRGRMYAILEKVTQEERGVC
jgi:hypothetical protein